MRLGSVFGGLLAALLLGPLSIHAELSEALKMLAAESDMIAVATVVEPPSMWGGSAPVPSEKPLAYWTETTVRVNLLAVIKGVPDNIKPLITARIPAFADVRENDDVGGNMARMYARGRKCILFLQDRRTKAELGKAGLNGEAANLVAFDPFFSCQGYDRAMEIALRELMARKQKP